MKKFLLIITCLVVFVLGGCGSVKTSFSYTYNVETGDKVKATLDTSDGYELETSKESVVKITKDGKTMCNGTFIKGEYYEQYVNAAKTDELAKIITEEEKDGNKYVMWNYNNSEYNCVMKIANSNTAVLISSLVSEDELKICLNKLAFSLE